jgi:hypothetical protein
VRVVLSISARVEPRRRRTSKTDRIHTMEAASRLRLVEKVAHFDPHDCEPPLRNKPENAMKVVLYACFQKLIGPSS